MKVWVNSCLSWIWDEEKPQFLLAIRYSKHDRKEWKGFSVYLHVWKWVFFMTVVNNSKEYERVMNRRLKPRVK